MRDWLWIGVAAAVLLLSPFEGRLVGQARDSHAPTWTHVIDRYLVDDYAGSTALLGRVLDTTSPADTSRIISDLRTAVVAAKGDQAARHLAVRRLKAAALVPLEALLPLSARVAYDARFGALEELLSQAVLAVRALESSQNLRDHDLSSFRQWAGIGYMQFLLNAGRLEDVERIAGDLRLPEHAGDLRVQHDLLRGMVRERIARLATGGRATAHTFIGGDTAAGPMGPGTSPAHAGGATMHTSRDVLARRYWTSAARWYERALEGSPDDPEGRLHLARTWIDRDAPARALELLQPLATPPCTSDTCALALLFSGEAQQRLGATDLASRAYRDAARDPRTRQSALLALMQLTHLRDDGTGLPLALQLQGEGSPANAVEPDAWGIYIGGRRASVDAILVPMRLEVRR